MPDGIKGSLTLLFLLTQYHWIHRQHGNLGDTCKIYVLSMNWRVPCNQTACTTDIGWCQREVQIKMHWPIRHSRQTPAKHQHGTVLLMQFIRDKIIHKYLHSTVTPWFVLNINSWKVTSQRYIKVFRLQVKMYVSPLSKLQKNIAYHVYKKYTASVCMIWMHFDVHLPGFHLCKFICSWTWDRNSR